MIDIRITPEQFSYDVQSLVQAFYPGHPFKINEALDNSFRVLKVYYIENQILAQ